MTLDSTAHDLSEPGQNRDAVEVIGDTWPAPPEAEAAYAWRIPCRWRRWRFRLRSFSAPLGTESGGIELACGILCARSQHCVDIRFDVRLWLRASVHVEL